jgi:hypothetical protein|uniref:Endonuclease/exonuclease/phosphatase domain-containing protein n=1 Tax=Sipha flava TaxID=143950 RepID=A0A2S2Q5Y5_9HEMI
MRLAAIRPHIKYGSAIFTKPSIDIISSKMTEIDDIEVITIDLGKCAVTSVYKPPNSPFKFHKPKNFAARNVRIIFGDFNCHSTSWEYNETNNDDHALETWAVSEELSLIHDHKLPPSGKRGYSPDIIFVSEAISIQCFKKMCEPIPSTQHRPIKCDISAAIKPNFVPFKRRFNFRKADWTAFAKELDEKIGCIAPTSDNYDQFVEIVMMF